MDDLIIEIPQELFAPAAFAHYEGTMEVPVMKAGADFYTFPQPVQWSFDLTNTGDAFLMQGEVEGLGVTSCAYCLERAEVDFFGDLDEYFLFEDVAEGEDLEEMEYQLLPVDHKIDLEPIIMAALLLDAPMLPLCMEDCQGVCVECGGNKNKGECTCKPDDGIDDSNPFAVLKGLKLD